MNLKEFMSQIGCKSCKYRSNNWSYCDISIYPYSIEKDFCKKYVRSKQKISTVGTAYIQSIGIQI